MPRRLIILIFFLGITFIGVQPPPVAHAACQSGTYSAGSGFSVTFGASGGKVNMTLPTGLFVHIVPGPIDIGGLVKLTVTAKPGELWTFTFSGSGKTLVTVTGTSLPGNCGGVPLPFMDGRCNQQADQTVAVYPDGKGGYQFYAIEQGVGYFAFRVSEQNLDDNPTKSTNYLIAHNLNVWLYRLSDGSLLVTGVKPDGKQYSFNIGSCGAMED